MHGRAKARVVTLLLALFDQVEPALSAVHSDAPGYFLKAILILLKECLPALEAQSLHEFVAEGVAILQDVIRNYENGSICLRVALAFAACPDPRGGLRDFQQVMLHAAHDFTFELHSPFENDSPLGKWVLVVLKVDVVNVFALVGGGKAEVMELVAAR